MARNFDLPFSSRWIGPETANYDPVTGTMLALTAAGAATSAAGTVMGGNAAKQAGVMGQQVQQYKAEQLDQQAVQTRAVAQRQAMEKGLQTTYALSELQSKAAASGGSATDPGVITDTGRIAGRGKYLALADMYQGENSARGLEAEAAGDIYTGNALKIEGEEKKTASNYAAAGTILGAGGSMFKSYGEMTNPYYRGRTV